MKNVRCKKFFIDRLKVLVKMGIFKDILFFGNFKFLFNGLYEGGIIV